MEKMWIALGAVVIIFFVSRNMLFKEENPKVPASSRWTKIHDANKKN